MRPSIQLSSRRAGHRIDCALSRGGVDGAAFPVALFGLILCASIITCEDSKADVGMNQPVQKMTPLHVDDAIRSHVVEADLRAGQSVQKTPPHHADDAIRAHVAEASRRFRIPADWIWAVMQAESAGDVRARSKKGAMGLMQSMPATWFLLRDRRGLGDDPYDPRDNILAGAAYLRDLHDRYGARGFLAAYNAGPGRYEDHLAGRRSLPAETVDYVLKVGRRIDSGVAFDAELPDDERIAALRSTLFPRAMGALSVIQETDEERSTVQSPADQLTDEKRTTTRSPGVQSADEKRSSVRSPVDRPTDEKRSFGGPSADPATCLDSALSRSSSDRVAVDLSAIAPSSTGLFARVTSR